jgi:hypothetical protein
LSKLSKLLKQLKSILKDTNKVALTLFKIMIPTLIVVKLLDLLGFTVFLGVKIEPLMTFLGLPPEAGLVWMASMLTNIYTGLAVFLTLSSDIQWSEAQVTVLGTLMLISHNLPIECRIAQKAGCRILTNLLLRMGGAIVLGFILHKIYSGFSLLQKPAIVAIPSQTEEGLFTWLTSLFDKILVFIIRHEGVSLWVANQIILCFQIYLVILALIAAIRFLREIGVERIISRILQPVLRLLGINSSATSITIVGITLGLAYGGGLLIQEAESGRVEKNDVFASITLLSLCHSQIEDTFLVMLLGAHLSGIFWGRLLFSLIVVFLVVHLQKRVSLAISERFFVTNVAKPVV